MNDDVFGDGAARSQMGCATKLQKKWGAKLVRKRIAALMSGNLSFGWMSWGAGKSWCGDRRAEVSESLMCANTLHKPSEVFFDFWKET